jgi:hypothetical protein
MINVEPLHQSFDHRSTQIDTDPSRPDRTVELVYRRKTERTEIGTRYTKPAKIAKGTSLACFATFASFV